MPNDLEGLSPEAQAAAGTFESPARFTREMAEESRHVVGDTILREAKPRGRPRKAAGERKEAVSIRLSPEVLAHFRAGGEGWQTRMDEVLRRYVAASLVRDLVGPADEVAQGLEVR